MIKLIVLSSSLFFSSCASPEITSKLIDVGAKVLVGVIEKTAEKKKKEKVKVKKTSQGDRGKSPEKKSD